MAHRPVSPAAPPPGAARATTFVAVRRTRLVFTAFVALATIMAGCSSGATPTPNPTTTSAATEASTAPTVTPIPLPANIVQAGFIKVVLTQSPPFVIIGESGAPEGPSIDLANALAAALGTKADITIVAGLAAETAGLDSARYDVDMGPLSDQKAKYAKYDLIDWTFSKLAFLAPAGNPKGVDSIEGLCGLKVAVLAGGSGERTVQQQSDLCVKAGKPAIEIQSYSDQNAMMLSVQAGRADVAGAGIATLLYYARQQGKLDVVAQQAPNIIGTVPQGLQIAHNQPVLLAALMAGMQKLFADGTYTSILDKYGLSSLEIPAPTLNGAVN